MALGGLVVLAGGCALAASLPGAGRHLLSVITIPGLGMSALRESGRAHQVRIQQQFTVRISPGSPSAPMAMMFDLEPDERPPHVEERKMGRCLPVGAIAAVNAAEKNRLALFLRDSRVVMATLAKACRANDFYSGFYVERSADGQLCVDRDRIHSRSGANCTIRDLRVLVEIAPRHGP